MTNWKNQGHDLETCIAWCCMQVTVQPLRRQSQSDARVLLWRLPFTALSRVVISRFLPLRSLT